MTLYHLCEKKGRSWSILVGPVSFVQLTGRFENMLSQTGTSGQTEVFTQTDNETVRKKEVFYALVKLT